MFPIYAVLAFIFLFSKSGFCSIDAVFPFVSLFEPLLYDTEILREHHVTRRSTNNPINFQFTAFNRQFTPILRHQKGILHSDLAVETARDSFNFSAPLTYSGYVKETNAPLFVIICSSGHFEGIILDHNDTFYIERSVHYANNTDFHTFIYRKSDVIRNSSQSMCGHAHMHPNERRMHKFEKEAQDVSLNSYDHSENDFSGNKYGMFKNHLNGGGTIYQRNKRAVDPTKTTCELYMQV
ncbi:ADA10-like protein [Mya arenaria]|uniref:ADA10-like protein n=1 Tax=Mya arenaria TaxID=6604 RepID=A0ABY7G3R4_MYAAR|nr:ADA10-like protein [Mya arenaria]